MKTLLAVALALFLTVAWPGTVTTDIVWRTSLEHAGKCSPRGADLNGDQVDDVVVGTGYEGRWGEVVTLDGRTGEVLWRQRLADEILTANPLLDINGDRVADVFACGRKGLQDVVAFSGRDGSILWRLSAANRGVSFPPINFSAIVLSDDRDGDGLADLLVTQSGGEDELRLAGRLYEVRSKDGKILSSRVTPDGRECYSIPLYERHADGPSRVYLGTGGETLSGNLLRLSWPAASVDWRIRELGGGFIGSPLAIDLDEDGADEILATTMGGSVYRIDAATGTIRWRWHERPWWTYVSPAAGAFDDDKTLDVVVGFNRGLFPRRDAAKIIWIDGATGRTLAQKEFEERWRWTASSPLVLDLDLDGRDETLIVLSNPIPDPAAPQETHRLLLFDGGDARAERLDLELPGYSIATPRLADLDADGRLDIVHASHYEVMRIALTVAGSPAGAAPRLPRIKWGELRGPNGAGVDRRSR